MENQARQTAVKTRISSLINGQYVVQQGWEPNYILYNDEKISRINIIGVIVSKNQNELSNNKSVMIDDGSGRISVRTFDESSVLDSVSVGEMIILIGRPREYGNEIYIVPEIIKPLQDKRWAEVRRLELELKNKTACPTTHLINTESVKTIKQEIKEDIVENEEKISEGDLEEVKDETEDIISSIRNLDKGDGADYTEVVSSSGKKAEEMISNLLKNGDIFELRPGKLKVLE